MKDHLCGTADRLHSHVWFRVERRLLGCGRTVSSWSFPDTCSLVCEEAQSFCKTALSRPELKSSQPYPGMNRQERLLSGHIGIRYESLLPLRKTIAHVH